MNKINLIKKSNAIHIILNKYEYRFTLNRSEYAFNILKVTEFYSIPIYDKSHIEKDLKIINFIQHTNKTHE